MKSAILYCIGEILYGENRRLIRKNLFYKQTAVFQVGEENYACWYFNQWRGLPGTQCYYERCW